jgi:hypothetical protein
MHDLSPPLDNQSYAFLSAADIVLLFSGVAKITASAAFIFYITAFTEAGNFSF